MAGAPVWRAYARSDAADKVLITLSERFTSIDEAKAIHVRSLIAAPQ